MSPARTEVLRRYFAALSAGDTAAVLALFSPDGIVVSPFLGSLSATAFFARLAAANQRVTRHQVVITAQVIRVGSVAAKTLLFENRQHFQRKELVATSRWTRI